MSFAESLAMIGTGKLILTGIFGIFALVLIVALVVGTAAVLGPGMLHVTRKKTGEPGQKTMPVSVRVLGFGIVFLAIGLGIVLSIYLLPMVTTWGTVGMVLLSGGIGLIIFYLIASRVEKRHEEVSPVPESE